MSLSTIHQSYIHLTTSLLIFRSAQASTYKPNYNPNCQPINPAWLPLLSGTLSLQYDVGFVAQQKPYKPHKEQGALLAREELLRNGMGYASPLPHQGGGLVLAWLGLGIFNKMDITQGGLL